MREHTDGGSTSTSNPSQKRKTFEDQLMNPFPSKASAVATSSSIPQQPLRISRTGPSAGTRRYGVQSLTVPVQRRPLGESQVGVAGRRVVSASMGIKKPGGGLGNRRTAADPGVRSLAGRSMVSGRSGVALSQVRRNIASRVLFILPCFIRVFRPMHNVWRNDWKRCHLQ